MTARCRLVQHPKVNQASPVGAPKSVFGRVAPGLAGLASLCVAATLTGGAMAAGEVSSVLVELRSATPFRYTVDDQVITWGLGDNQIMTGLVAGGERYDYADVATRVELQRVDIPGVATGEPCGVMGERLDGLGLSVAVDYPADNSGTGNCDMSEALTSRIINRGVVDLFSNVAPDAKNIERADFLFDQAMLAPVSTAGLRFAGHAVGEKQGNNPIQIAAILELDVFGQPSRYGPLVRINPQGCSDPEICYSDTDLAHDYAFFQNERQAPQGFPSITELSRERISMALVSTEALGLSAAQRYFGFSLFGDDVNAADHVLTDPSTYPNDTTDAASVLGDEADVHGGLAGYFLADSLSIASGSVFLDADGDGVFGEGDAGLSDIGITLHQDVNGDGFFDPAIDVALHEAIDSGLDGAFQLPGIPSGAFFVVLDESDADIPGGLTLLPGINPFPLPVAGNDADDVNFVFTNGAGAGASDAGASDAGASDAGASDAGASDAGASDAGASDAGASDAGASDAGASDAGASDAGASDAGESDTGGADGNAGGDAVTAANADFFTLDQGERLSAPVLANDTDASGGGLTIISVSESPNATITIVDDMVIYAPDADFYGSDTFMYTIEDADGTQATGVVAVDVERFSDINDNGFNDFDECDNIATECGDLRLETGVRGAGVGALSWQAIGGLLALLGVPLMRRRAARPLLSAERS